MKKNLRALFAALAVCCLFVLPSSAEDEWMFVFNDEMCYFSASMPPITEENILYIPLDTVMERLGAHLVYDELSRTISIFRGEYIVSYNMETMQVVNSNGRFAYAKTFYANKTFYIPAVYFVQDLGGKVEILADGTIRITNGRQRMTAAELDCLIASMPSRRPAEVQNAPLFLLIRGTPGRGLERAVEAIGAKGVPAAFFFTEGDILSSPATVRSLYVEGYAVGVYVGGSDGVDDAIERAQQALEAVIKTRTPFVYLPKRLVGGAARLERAGYIVWGSNIEASSDGATLSLATVIGRVKWRSALFVGPGDAAALQSVLGALGDDAGSRVRPLSEVTARVRP